MTVPLNPPLISPEQEIVIASIRVDHQQDDRLIQLLKGELDWSTLRQFALNHGVLPLLYSLLKTMGADLVPPEELERLKELFLVNAQRNLRLTRMLVRVSDIFTKHEIQSIPVKGPIFAVQLYGDTSQRHFSDLDLIVREEDFRKCHQVLSAAGFTPKFPVSIKQEPWLLRGDTEHPYSYQGDTLELHWAIAERGIYYTLDTAVSLVCVYVIPLLA